MSDPCEFYETSEWWDTPVTTMGVLLGSDNMPF